MEQSLEMMKKSTLHRAVSFFEDIPCYEKDTVLKLQELNGRLMWGKAEEEAPELIRQMNDLMDSMTKKADAPQKIVLWPEGNMPSLGEYTDNSDLRFNHDPDFIPYMYEIPMPEGVSPKGAVVVCAGGDHGDCTIHEGYQSCVDLSAHGYKCFLLLNRTNHCPFDPKEAGADASRAIRYVRKNAAKYGIDENRVAFAGFSNGGLTAEACVQYYSGTQKIKTHFKDYREDELDGYYGAPDAIVCVYGPRFAGASFDYTNAVYPPVFFAVGRDDSAMKNLESTYPDLRAHGVEVEVHTFSGVPHGQSGVTIYGNNNYTHFQLWVPLADAFLQNVFSKSVVKKRPDELKNKEYRYDSFANDSVLLNKKKGHLPAMGWNSWNAFGSGNTEALTRAMADKMKELELDSLGYEYLVLDDGCYKPVRVDGRLSNDEDKFPGGFKKLADYIHEKGLKFGMYNDIGTNLCAGAAVGTCGHEKTDAASYVEWDVDFLKVDNCYYLWDNATFSNAENAKYVYAPNVWSAALKGHGIDREWSGDDDFECRGEGIERKEGYWTNIGTFDGTGPWASPVGARSGELVFIADVPEDGEYDLFVRYSTAMESGVGSWLQIAVGEGEASELVYDDFMPASENKDTCRESEPVSVTLHKGANVIRFMNHRRQENTLCSYAALLEGLNEAKPDHDIIFSICEWGKTQPQNWGYKVGDSWRILNDITFRVGADGDPGFGSWKDEYTPSVTSQYNKAVIMDEFAGLDKGWNDPDMLMVGMNGLTYDMQKTHMAMWCMMNSPLMLGLDLRRVQKGDELWQIIANRDLIELNQDALGVAAKRVFSSIATGEPDKEYIRDLNRADILAKPLADGSVAVMFINVSDENECAPMSVTAKEIVAKIGGKMPDSERFASEGEYRIRDLWTKEETKQQSSVFECTSLAPCESKVYRITKL